MDYSIRGSTIFIKVKNIINHYKIDGDKVMKVVEDEYGEETFEHFHTLNSLPTNSEKVLLNDLRKRKEI